MQNITILVLIIIITVIFSWLMFRYWNNWKTEALIEKYKDTISDILQDDELKKILMIHNDIIKELTELVKECLDDQTLLCNKIEDIEERIKKEKKCHIK